MPNTPRVPTDIFQDTSGRTITQSYALVAYAATMSIAPKAQYSTFNFAQLTGAATVNAVVTDQNIGDESVLLFAADGTQRIVTLGTNILSSGTLTIPASKTASVTLVFDGTNFRCMCREITA